MKKLFLLRLNVKWLFSELKIFFSILFFWYSSSCLKQIFFYTLCEKTFGSYLFTLNCYEFDGENNYLGLEQLSCYYKRYCGVAAF